MILIVTIQHTHTYQLPLHTRQPLHREAGEAVSAPSRQCALHTPPHPVSMMSMLRDMAEDPRTTLDFMKSAAHQDKSGADKRK